MFATLNRFAGLIILAAMLALTGCVSSGSSVSGYGGPSVSSATAKRTAARKDLKEARRELRVSKSKLTKLERTITRNEKRLKRKKISSTRKARYEKALKAAQKELRPARRAVRSAERAVARAERKADRATRAIARAKRREEAAERRAAEAERRRATREARKQLERDEPRGRRSLFASADPALTNVKDYRARTDNGFQIPAIPVNKVNKRLLRQEVSYRTSQKPGTIVVDTGARYLYLVQRGGKAMRYGIGVGRAGFAWSGAAHIGWKQEWPKWTPPDEMIARQPQLEKYSTENGGMPGGLSNPLGARALYLMKDGKDTLYRLHGTPQWASIGTAASSGCIRLMNQDIIDLYNRVPHGTKVVVI